MIPDQIQDELFTNMQRCINKLRVISQALIDGTYDAGQAARDVLESSEILGWLPLLASASKCSTYSSTVADELSENIQRSSIDKCTTGAVDFSQITNTKG